MHTKFPIQALLQYRKAVCQLAVLLSVCLLGSGACTVIPRSVQEWPPELPPMDYYIEYYRNDPSNHSLQSEAEYLTWVRRFYLGWELYPFGWVDLESDVQGLMGNSIVGTVTEKLRYLGRTISADWARHNTIHSITTSILALWGEVIEAALEEDKADAAIDLITRDVESLINGANKAEDFDPVYYEAWLGIYLEELF